MPSITNGTALKQISQTHKVGHMLTEDSAFSIYFLILRSGPSRSDSWAELEGWVDRRTGTDLLRWSSLAVFRETYRRLLAGRVRRTAAARLNPFAAEFISQAILKKLGIGTVPAQICRADEVPAEPGHVIKAVGPTGDLKFSPTRRGSGFVLVSRIVENTASVDYIRRKFLPSLRSPFTWRGLGEVEIGEIDEQLSFEATRALMKSCPSADELSREFKPASLYQIRESIRGEPYLKILAARIFLGTSAGHFANVLCTARGDLLSIDHARAQRESGEDLQMLFRFVRHGSRAFDLLGEIAALTEDDVRMSVSEIPKHPACGSTAGLADYFVSRLRLWRSLHEAAPSRAVASAAV